MDFHENGTVDLRKGIVTEILSTEQDMRVEFGFLEFILRGVMVTVSVVTMGSQRQQVVQGGGFNHRTGGVCYKVSARETFAA
jgi:hypothetical protein